ncbi:MAG: metal ABC transporter permease [Deltaproteobacteria bacterium]|nr:metal ABC transporter permease [Deltaproteobacteria bacterium]
MAGALAEVLNPSFLLFPAVVGSIVLGLVCPAVGGFLVLRRSVLLGLTLPQLAAAGVAFALFAHEVGLVPHPGHASEDAHEVERLLAYGGSLLFTFAGMVVLGLMDRRGTGRAEIRLAVAYALAGSLTVLLVAFHPFGDVAILSLVKGEAVVLSWAELATLGGVYAVVMACLILFRRELLISSFDRDLTALLKGGVAVWDLLLYLLAGLTVALGVMMAGPLLTFGFLVLPPIAVRPLVSRMAPYFMAASLAGVSMAVAGFAVCYRFDLPLGPTMVALGCGLVLCARIVAWIGIPPLTLRRRGTPPRCRRPAAGRGRGPGRTRGT